MSSLFYSHPPQSLEITDCDLKEAAEFCQESMGEEGWTLPGEYTLVGGKHDYGGALWRYDLPLPTMSAKP